MSRWFFAILFTAVIVACYTLPAVILRLTLWTKSNTYHFSIKTPFEGEGFLQKLEMDSFDFSENEAAARIAKRIIISVVAYFSAMVFLVGAVWGRFCRTSRALDGVRCCRRQHLTACLVGVRCCRRQHLTACLLYAAAIALHGLSGRLILTVPRLVVDSAEGLFGFFAMFIEIEELIEISLGMGYWVVLGLMCCGLLVDFKRLVFHDKCTNGRSV
ncbi:MAG: hypothetical protein FWG87_09715 [Defluviitaleaceae bacterium]|nr:hypothetical protein [Defluviitaleaceae bacterium]